MSQEAWTTRPPGSTSSTTRFTQDHTTSGSRKESRHDDYDDGDRRRSEAGRNRSDRDRYGKSSNGGYASRSHDSDRDSRRYKDSRSSRRYRSRSRSSSYESRSRHSHRKQSSRSRRSSSKTAGTTGLSASHKSQERHGGSKHVRIVRASRSRSKSKTKSPPSRAGPDRAYFEMMYNKSDKHHAPIDSMDIDFDKEKIHKEMQERLIQHLAKEGKVYPPPKPQASHPVFANDGSFLETFKQLQQQQQQYRGSAAKAAQQQQQVGASGGGGGGGSGPTNQLAQHPNQQQPMFGKRRGGKILKTGIVEKPRIVDESASDVNQNDAWAMYMQEVKKYKNVSCDADAKTRPLVK